MKTRITELFGIERPIIQGGMHYVGYAELAAAVSNAGGLGILASATMTFEELEHAIVEVKGRTDQPFGVNLRADAADAPARVDLLIKHGVKVASFALAPKKELIAKLKDLNVGRRPLIVTEDATENVYLSSRNLPYVQVRDVQGLDPVALVGADTVVITSDAVKKIEEWLA